MTKSLMLWLGLLACGYWLGRQDSVRHQPQPAPCDCHWTEMDKALALLEYDTKLLTAVLAERAACGRGLRP